jgi:predicted GTPase
MEVGTAAGGGKTAGELEVAQVIHEARATSAVVLTYDPECYTGHRIDVVDLRP